MEGSLRNIRTEEYISKPVRLLFETRKQEEERLKTEALIQSERKLAETNRELNKALETLKESELKFREFFESAPEAIAIVDMDTQKFVDFNSNMLKMFKYSPEEMLQIGPVDISPDLQPDGCPSFVKAIELIGKVMQGNQPAFEWTNCDSEGKEIPCEMRLTKLSVAGRNLFRGSIIDISEKKLAAESLHQSEANLRTIFENTEVGFLLIDVDSNVVACNDMINQWAKESFGTILTKGMNVREMLIPEKLNEFDGLKSMILGGGQVNYETEYPDIDGTLKWHHVTGNPVMDENKNVTGICFALNNITLRKKAEAEIAELNESLEKKVKERTVELEASNKELESFSYSVSHDLRAPLRIVDGFAKMLLKRNADKLDKDGKEYLEIIMTNAKRMGHLIDDLLGFSSLNRTAIVKSTVSMNYLVKGIVADLKSAEPNAAVEIQINNLKPAEADFNLMRQVWINLVSNAVKYSRKNASPRIEVGTIEESGQTTYYIKDNGAGFDMKYYDKLFSVFQRLHKVNEYEGTGVGLALVQRIITRHGGKIWAEAKVNEGATFYFTLPSAQVTLM